MRVPPSPGGRRDVAGNLLTQLPALAFNPALLVLSASNNPIASFLDATFENSSQLVVLYLSGCSLSSLPDAASFARLTALQEMYLENNTIGHIRAGFFATMPGIKFLALDNNNLTAVERDTFQGLGGDLINLGLGNNSLTSLDTGALRNMTQLVYLRLNDNYLTVLKNGTFASLRALQELYLGDNRLVVIEGGVFQACAKLGTLDLSRNHLTAVGGRVFAGLSLLDTLSLNSNAIARLGEGTLFPLAALTLLQLQSNNLTGTPPDAFKNLSKLSFLNLEGNAITSLEVGQFNGLSTLRTLYLQNNQITTLPKSCFAGFKKHPWREGYVLTSLHLENNMIRTLQDGWDDGLQGLGSLNLAGNQITAVDADAWVSLPDDLNLDYNPVRHTTGRWFRSAKMFESTAPEYAS